MEGSETHPLLSVTRWWVDASDSARVWIDPMVEEQALGYKHKRRTLQEIVQSSRKEAAQLIGYNEVPVSVPNNANSAPKEVMQDLEAAPPRLPQSRETTSSDLSQELTAAVAPSKSLQDSGAIPFKLLKRPETVTSKSSIQRAVNSRSTARTKLYEICAANRWERPSFVLCNEEGPGHQKMFTFKVTVNIQGTNSTQMECYGEPKNQKKAAEESAAEGALWCLEHLGQLPKA